MFFAPNALGHPDNYIPANPLATPAHIVPEWYFWPFYAILRAFTVDFILPAKLWGVLAMFASILLLFFLPWLDKSPVRSGAYRPVFKRFFWLLVVDVLILGCAADRRPTPLYVALSQIASAYYFAHFLIILPLVSKFETPLPLPNSISRSVLHGEKQEAAPVGISRAAAAAVTGTRAACCASSLGLIGARLRRRAADLAGRRACRPISATPAEPTAEHEFHKHPKQLALASDGPFGKFDRQQLQRGFQVYKEVCAACHGLSLVSFRDLARRSATTRPR